jgi:membrane-bound ClpP family serine protease
MSLGLVIFLILLGLFLLVIEVLLIPGITIAGIGGALCMISGIIIAFVSLGTITGVIVLLTTVILTVITIVLMLKADTWKRLMLTKTIDGKVDLINKEEGKVKPGDTGITVTRLAPGGKVLVNGEYYEAKSIDMLIDPRSGIEVVKIDDNKLIVKPIKM